MIRTKRGSSVLVCSLLILGSGCDGKLAPAERSQPKIDAAVARGTGVQITDADVRHRLLGNAQGARAVQPLKAVVENVVDELVDQQLLAAEARRRGLEADPEAKAAIHRALVDALLRQLRTAQPPPAMDEQQRYYEEHRDDFIRPERVRLSYLFLSASGQDGGGHDDARAKAARVREELGRISSPDTAAEAFASAAMKLSDDPKTRAVRGDLTFRTREELDAVLGEEVARGAWALRTPGALSGVIETPEGFHLLRLTAREAERSLDFAAARPEIISRLERVGRMSQLEALRAELRAAAKVSVDEAAVDRLAGAAALDGGTAGL